MTHIYHNPTSTSQPISGKFYRRPLTKSWLQGWKVIHLSESNHIPVGATESIQRGGNFPPDLQHAFVHAHSQKWAILSQQVGGFSHKKTLKFESKPKNRLESWFIRFTTKHFFLKFSVRGFPQLKNGFLHKLTFTTVENHCPPWVTLQWVERLKTMQEALLWAPETACIGKEKTQHVVMIQYVV